MLKQLFTFLLLSTVFAASAQYLAPPPQQQPGEHGLVKWMSFKEAQELNKKQPKPFLIDVYTDWCGWCKKMIATTYSDQGLANYINTYFYPVQLDAETKDTIEYNGTKYVNNGTGKKPPHQLAVKLLNGQMTYPSTIFVANNFQFNLLTQGYLEVRKIEPILIFSVENAFRTTAYEEFKVNFEKTFYDTVKTDRDLKWYTMKEALDLHKKKPKKILISINTSFCNTCKVMNKTTFSDAKNLKYISDNYYLVDLNAENKDDIEFNGTVFKNDGSNGFPFHQFALALTKNNFVLPSTAILDEKLQLMDVIPFYLSPNAINPVLRYFGDDKYKTEKWDEFLKKEQGGEKK